MNGGLSEDDLVDDVDDIDIDDDDSDDLLSSDDIDSDNIGDLSVEINVEELVRKLEATSSHDVDQRRQIRRRLEELRELREVEKDLDSTFNFNLDDDD